MSVQHTALFVLALAAPCFADVFTFSGNFAPLDAQFDAYIDTFVLTSTADVTIQSFGYAAGGFDPIVSLFRGSGPSAEFVDLNDDEDPGVVLDSYLTLSGLVADTYTIAITYASNAPNAYYWGGGTLGDGFNGLGWDVTGRSDYFRVDVSTSIPEPATLLLLGTTAFLLVSKSWRRVRRLL